MPRKILLWSGLALPVAYLLLGYLAGPLLVLPALEHQVAAQLDRDLRVERVRVDPLTWSVRLDTVELLANSPQSLWPDVLLSASRVDLRYSFWRLSPAVSELRLQEPALALATELHTEAGPVLFGLRRQWEEHDRAKGERDRIPVDRWRLEAGRMLLGSGGSAAGAVLMDDVFLQTDAPDSDGLRPYTAAFSVAGKGSISSQGMFRHDDLSATGTYQWRSAANMDAGMTEFQVAGAFASTVSGDGIQMDLRDSQLNAQSVAGCVLDGLLCAAIAPLAADFDSQVLATADGIRMLQADARLGAFRLDASMGEGRVEWADQRQFDNARLEFGLPQASPADQGGRREFTARLSATDADQYLIDGQLDLQSQAAEAQFRIIGAQLNGALQLRSVDGEPAQAAHSRLDLQLENPAANLVREFMDEYLTHTGQARNLRLRLVASLDDQGLKLQEHISISNLRLLPDTESATRLDAPWLFALLQDPNDLIEMEIPELRVDSATAGSFDELVQRQVLSTLTEFAEQPFTALAGALAIANPRLDEIHFAPGSAAVDAVSSETFADLATILMQRPRLGLAVTGVYDPVLDKRFLQTEQLRTHVALAMAADLEFRTGAEPPDFRDPIVHSVIDEFARRRLPAEVMQAFAEDFGVADVDQGVQPEGDVVVYYSTLFELLVANADIPQSAMTSLARYRAQAVMEGLQDAGVSRDRVEAIGQAIAREARAEGIALPLQLQPRSDLAAESAL